MSDKDDKGNAKGNVFDMLRRRAAPGEGVPGQGTDAAPSTAAPSPGAPAPPPAANLPPYVGVMLDAPRSRPPRFEIFLAHDVSTALPYIHLQEVLSTANQFVSLLFGETVFTITGRNLRKLVEGLRDEQVLGINVFDPLRSAPPEAGEPLITAIERRSRAEWEAELFGDDDATAQ